MSRSSAIRAAAEALFSVKSTIAETQRPGEIRSSTASIKRAIKTMKIAQVSPLAEAVPPTLYGGTERVVAYLTDALIELVTR
jgi:hypothetical protein